jgi:peptidoglycan hydrolase-like protein with peptidoglycan-binding domain
MTNPEALPQVSPSGWSARLDYDRRPAVQDRDGATVHWTGTKGIQARLLDAPDLPEAERSLIRSIERDHIERNGWDGIGYSHVTGPSGLLYRARSAAAGAHNPGDSDGDGVSDNRDSYGLLLLVGPGDEPTPKMWATVCRYLDAVGGTIAPHSATRVTGCPGEVVRGMLDRYLEGAPAPAPATAKPTPDDSPTWTDQTVQNLPTLKIRTDLGRSSNDDRRAQGLLAAAGVLSIRANSTGDRFDGKFGKSTDTAVRSYQRGEGLTVDGIIGRNTWESLLLG